MNFREAIEGAESHYERAEYLESLSLGILALGLALKEAQEDEEQPEWVAKKRWRDHMLCDFNVSGVHHSLCRLVEDD